MLEKIFKKLNLGKAEESVYVALMDSGSVSAGFLARKIHIPRSSLYGYLETLRAKGLVRQSQKYDKKIWQAEPVETIGALIQEEIDGLHHAKENFLALLPEFQKKHDYNFVAPTMTYFEGVDGVRKMFRDILLYQDLDTVAIWSIKDVLQFLGREFMKELTVKRAASRISLRVIWPEEKSIDFSKFDFLVPSKEQLRDIRIAPKMLNTSMGYWVYGNKTLFISSKREAFGFIVESTEFANMLRHQFEVFWQMSKPVK